MLPVSSSFLQLEVLTNLANETNISTILREFQVCHGHTEAATLVMALGAKPPPWRGQRRAPPGGSNPISGSKGPQCVSTSRGDVWHWHMGDMSRVPSMPVQTYIRSMDKDFVAATIQAIGRCATNIGKVRDTCLNGLVQLLSNRDGECTQQA